MDDGKLEAIPNKMLFDFYSEKKEGRKGLYGAGAIKTNIHQHGS